MTTTPRPRVPAAAGGGAPQEPAQRRAGRESPVMVLRTGEWTEPGP